MVQIKFRPQEKELSLEEKIEAAWQFAYATLWQEQHFTPKEISRAKDNITFYLIGSTNEGNALVEFCERIILAKRCLTPGWSAYLPLPSIWFNAMYMNGFSETQRLHDYLQMEQGIMPGYQKGISIMAQAYIQYIRYPCRKTFSACHKRLTKLKEYGLIQLFYNSIIYSQLLHPIK